MPFPNLKEWRSECQPSARDRAIYHRRNEWSEPGKRSHKIKSDCREWNTIFHLFSSQTISRMHWDSSRRVKATTRLKRRAKRFLPFSRYSCNDKLSYLMHAQNFIAPLRHVWASEGSISFNGRMSSKAARFICEKEFRAFMCDALENRFVIC